MSKVHQEFIRDFGLIVLPKHIEVKVEECLARMLELKTAVIWDVRYLGSSLTPSGQAEVSFVAHGYTKGEHEKDRRKYATTFLIFLPELVQDAETCAARAIADADKAIRELLNSEEGKEGRRERHKVLFR